VRRRSLVAVTTVGLAGLLALGALISIGSYVLSGLSDCSGKERAIVEEYPHYGERRIATYPWTFSCSVSYTTEASRKEVLGYYEDLLRRHGWEVMGFNTPHLPKGMEEREAAGKRLSDLWELPESAGGALVARRDGYSYWVSYEAPNKEDPDLPDDKALVRVSANDHPPPASRFPG
jgi:hypothetical protein